MVTALAVLLSAMSQTMLSAYAISQHIPNSIENAKHQHHTIHKMMQNKVLCHNTENKKISQKDCFTHCLEMLSQPFKVSLSRFVKDCDYKEFAYSVSGSHAIVAEDFSQLVATGPPKYYHTLNSSSGISALISLNMRLRI
ncbi:MAG: hypothetical protein AAF228_11025 [Pseudomonadota bacterium]